MTTRPCELCADWDEKYLEEYLAPETVCGACNGSKVLDIRDCFCGAYEPSECGCDADWSDFVHEDDYTYWEDEPVLYTKEMQEVNNQEYYKELVSAKQNGEKLSWIQEDFLERYGKVVAIPVDERWKTQLTACFDEDDNFVGLVGKQENGLYKIVSKTVK